MPDGGGTTVPGFVSAGATETGSVLDVGDVRVVDDARFERTSNASYSVGISLEPGAKAAVDLPAGGIAILQNPGARVEATLDDGSQLPGWVNFDTDTRELAINPPSGINEGSITVVVTASDNEGNEVVTRVTVNLEPNAVRPPTNPDAEEKETPKNKSDVIKPGSHEGDDRARNATTKVKERMARVGFTDQIRRTWI